jgi:hypothetical protein
MNLKKLSTLKDKLMEAKDFREPWNYFFDHFGDDPEFMMKAGKRADDTVLKQVIAHVGQELFNTPKVSVTNMLLTEIPKYHFIHGGCFIQGRMATLIFFDDIDMGLLAVSMGGHETMFARFSSIIMEGKHGEDVFVVPNAGSHTLN